MTETQVTELIDNGKLQELIEAGISEKQLIEAFEIKKKQWSELKEKHPELRTLCEKASGVGFLEAQATLLKRAKGYYYTEEHQEIPIDVYSGKPIGEGKLVKNKKWCPPDPEALNKVLSIQLLLATKEEK